MRRFTKRTGDIGGVASRLTRDLDANTNDIINVDEIELDDAASDASASGRLRRNAQKLTWHDGNAARVFPVVLDRDVTSTTVSNTGAETSVYSFSVPGGTLGTNRMIRITLLGYYANTSAGAVTFQVRVKYGATLIGLVSSASIASDADNRIFTVKTDLSALNATNAQTAVTAYLMGAADTGSTGGGSDATLLDHKISMHNAIAEDSTLAKTLEVTVQHGSAALTITAVVQVVQVELI